MLKFYNYDIVFQEIPDEVTLAVNITHCPHRCPHCHSPFLWEDTSELFNEENARLILKDYRDAITCLSIMGGDNDPRSQPHGSVAEGNLRVEDGMVFR